MICPECNGTGVSKLEPAFKGNLIIAICETCGGCGHSYCCEGERVMCYAECDLGPLLGLPKRHQ